MSDDRTEIEWNYTPADFFEAPYRTSRADYELLLEGGVARATLRVPQEIDAGLQKRITSDVAAVLRSRQLLTHRPFQLHAPRVLQVRGGKRNTVVSLRSAEAVTVGMSVDAVVTDSTGNVIADTRAERIRSQTDFIDAVAPKAARSPVLISLLESYSRAVEDPANELVHLYEIRDAIVKHHGNEQAARTTLGISSGEWSRFGKLANAEPVEEGRHRGRHPSGRRPATREELAEVRATASRLIEAFARTI